MTATTQVTYGSGSSSNIHAILELDDELNINADGEVLTSFDGSSTVWFLFHAPPGYGPGAAYCSYGALTECGQVNRAKTVDGAVWTPEQTSVELPHYPAGSVSASWQGNAIELAAVSGRTLAAAADPLAAIARADLQYTARFWLYRWDPPSGFTLAENTAMAVEIMIEVQKI